METIRGDHLTLFEARRTASTATSSRTPYEEIASFVEHVTLKPQQEQSFSCVSGSDTTGDNRPFSVRAATPAQHISLIIEHDEKTEAN